MSSLWEQLWERARQSSPPPIARLDLWEAAEKVVRLELVVEALTREFETYRTQADQEIDRLRMKVDVLQAHDARRK